MSFLAWMVLGTMAGFFAGKVEHKKRNQGIALHLPLGILGAVIGGLVFDGFGSHVVHSLNQYSVLGALLGAALLLAIYHVLFRRS